MKILHIIAIGLNGGTNIFQKYLNYIDAFHQLNVDYNLYIIAPEKLPIKETKHVHIEFVKYTNKKYLLRRLYFHAKPLIDKKINEFKPSHIILRIDHINSTIFNLAKSYKLILEYPNAPVEKSLLQKPFYNKLSVKYNNKILKKSLFNIVTVNNTSYENSFILPNSLLPNRYTSKKTITPIINKVNILFLSSKYGKYEYNGYDRFLLGLESYLKNNYHLNFSLYFAGGEKQDFNSFIDNFDLKNTKIIHLGYTNINELNKLIPIINLGINDIGYHRQNIKYNSTLKTVDFIGWNLPFILSHNDINIQKDDKYYLKVEENDSEINIPEILEFLNYIETKELEKMKKQAEKICLKERLWKLLQHLEKYNVSN